MMTHTYEIKVYGEHFKIKAGAPRTALQRAMRKLQVVTPRAKKDR
jgi:phosphatidylethanolamine-binding protein (PEBP) family uncharacterized protein